MLDTINQRIELLPHLLMHIIKIIIAITLRRTPTGNFQFVFVLFVFLLDVFSLDVLSLSDCESAIRDATPCMARL